MASLLVHLPDGGALALVSGDCLPLWRSPSLAEIEKAEKAPATIGSGLGQPVITQQPLSCTNMAGTTATSTVTASGKSSCWRG